MLEAKASIDYGYQKVERESVPLQEKIEELEKMCVSVIDSHIDRLAWKFKPKLNLAEEKVKQLEQIVKAKEKARAQRE